MASLWIYVRVKGLDRETDKIVLLLYLFQRILQIEEREKIAFGFGARDRFGGANNEEGEIAVTKFVSNRNKLIDDNRN